MEEELSQAKLLVSQHEAKMHSLQENMKTTDEKKRHLEETLDELNNELVKLKASGKLVDHFF